MCMAFCYNPQIIFCRFFRSLDLVISVLKAFRHLVNATPLTVLAGSFLNFAAVFVSV